MNYCSANLGQEVDDTTLRTTDDRLLSLHHDRTLKQRLLFGEQVDDSLGISDVVLRVQLELFEARVLTDEILNGVLKTSCDHCKRLAIRWFFHVEDDVVVYTQFLGDRQGIL